MGEHISQGGVSLRVPGVKVPRGTRLFFFLSFPYFSGDGAAFIPSFILGGSKVTQRLSWGLLECSR